MGNISRSSESFVAPPIVHEVLKESGRPLDPSAGALMESRFGRDFSHVRLHHDAKAAESARAVGALAYTAGRDIVFGPGYWAADESRRQGLLAHELAHVVQQPRSNFCDGPIPMDRADSPWEAEADAASRAVLSGNRASVLHRTAQTLLARSPDTKAVTEPDGSQVQVERIITPGKCRLVPKNRSESSANATSSQAFLEFDFCRGRVGAHGRGELNYGDAIKKASAIVAKFLNNPSQLATQGMQKLRDELNQIDPNANITLSVQAPKVRLKATATGEVSGQGASGTATGSAKVEIGPVVVGTEVQVHGGKGERTETQVLFTIGTSGGTPDRNCFVCACDEPKPEFRCLRKPPPSSPTPPKQEEPVIVPLFFAYSTTEPRAKGEYEKEIALAVSRLRDGYRLDRIEGNASPEGPEQPRQRGGFNNRDLSQQRAAKARDDLQAALQGALAWGMRDTANLRAALTALKDAHRIKGQGELFGSTGKGEIAERDLFRHLQTELREPAAGDAGQDKLAEKHVTGANLPADVEAGVEEQVKEFRTGRKGDQKLTKSEQLEAIYQPLRRALIFLQPPPPPPVDLFGKSLRSIDASIVGEDIECSDAHKALYPAEAQANQMFVGECNKPGEKTVDTGHP